MKRESPIVLVLSQAQSARLRPLVGPSLSLAQRQRRRRRLLARLLALLGLALSLALAVSAWLSSRPPGHAP